ncbi:MAG: arsenate reductase ArsC [Bryobacteraceae bacterium]|nr:arsenate reductase ArsC [Bryobacteraceae bacterium]
MREKILVLCTGNSARSQMAEGLLREALGGRFEIHSAGTRPSHVRPEAIEVMRELGLDISGHRSKHLDEFRGTEFRYVITVCDHAAETCPAFSGIAERIHWSFEDPAAVEGDEQTRLAAFRRIRDQIAEKVRSFAAALRTGAA